ncbi:protein O-mannosyl-transferase family [Sediminibacterium soli]|uniref:protein O-mannosyl-transferase family n=1 Tax=Sediminibacterium soli TaxID=2698829 RepID=UPI0013794636|nr:DUF2723 domain-containing protein [Sediminibacterium soli]NCI46938.1 DUF2723 domain-containing protein [Sediminibacterium soli]
MQFRKINNIAGWVICLIACGVYILTAEARGSFWDCGEFVSSCFKLQIPHPPGAPLFVILGRFFIVLFGNDALSAAKAVNIMNALASGFTILFLFWTITHFARKIVNAGIYDTLTQSQAWSIIGAGAVGALAYTFSDSFWYSAVEGEVYAMSSFFTAIVFWAILKWENHADEPGSDKWIVFIFFMMGLSIGVHLLNLLTIPAIVMVYYFRRMDSFNYAVVRKWFLRVMIIGGVLAFIGALMMASKESTANVPMDSTMAGLVILAVIIGIGLLFLIENVKKQRKAYYGGMYIFLLIGCAVTGIVQVGVIQYTVKMAGTFDRIFVNSFGLPFFSGFVFFFAVLSVLIWLGLKFASKKAWSYLRLSLWCLVFMLVGYSTYVTTMIRSSANPSVDMYNVDNPMSLEGYLGREQYGDFPLLYGQKFTAQPADMRTTGMRYQKSNDKYIELGEDRKYVYAAEDKMVFPRVWDASNEQNHAAYYANYLGIGQTREGGYERAPDQFDNVKFFVGYQTYWMYLRYFFWNFAGKQNDNQGIFTGNVRDGNWKTGLPLDNIFYGDQSSLPDSLKNNKANNKLFALPLILGLIGMFYHFKRKGSDAVVNILLFFFTGMAIVLYLNQAGMQPRERDYAYVGSFYAFAVWIGLGVLKVRDWFAKKMTGVTAPALATVICLLAVPVLMAQQEWDDHDRSKKLLPPDLAKDYLESCAPNAILFTFGDNDTYPLWYAQEVEGVRPDVRVVNFSLLGIDWYINQLRYKVNQSAPIDVIWSPEQIEGSKRDYVLYHPRQEIPEDRYYDLYDMMKNYVGSDDPAKMEDRGGGDALNTFPVRKMSVPVDRNMVLKNQTVNANDSIVGEMRFDITKRALMKNDLALLNVIAANKWNRPVYFTNDQVGLGFDQYLRRDGLTWRLIPVINERTAVNTDYMFNKAMNVFGSGNANVKGVYFDEENRRHLRSIRDAYTDLAMDLANKNRKEEAVKVLRKADGMIDQDNYPYGFTGRANLDNRSSLIMMQAALMAGDKELAKKIGDSVKKDLEQQIRYYNGLPAAKAELMSDERRIAEDYLKSYEQIQAAYNPAIQIPGKTMAPADTAKTADSAKK